MAVAPPGDAVTIYPVIGEPPSEGAVHESVTLPLPTLTIVGADIVSGAVGWLP